MKSGNIIIVGVGGQGSLLASRFLGELFVSLGYDVKLSEVHGMSQRGGSVITYVRFGQQVASPLIDFGEADYILSFELLEAARYLPYLRKGGRIIANTQQIDPMPVITGKQSYPQDLKEQFESLGVEADLLDCLSLAGLAGSVKAVNIVLLGRLSRYFDYPEEIWYQALERVVPPKFLEINRKAFALGREKAPLKKKKKNVSINRLLRPCP